MTRIIAAFVVIALTVVLFTDDLRFFKSSSSEKPYGKVISVSGFSMGKTRESDDFTALIANSSLEKQHFIKTGADGEVTVEYGEVVKIAPDSLVQLSKKGRYHIVDLKQGSSLQRPNPQPNTLFYYDGKLKRDDSLQAKAPTKTSQIDPKIFSNTEGQLMETSDPEFKKTLSETVKLHQRFLEKCYIKLYESTAGKTAGGQLLVQFKVTKLGKVKKAQVKESDFSDERFKDCVEEVISRVRFKAYKGPEREVILPLNIASPTS